jgi:hypothetical protein
LSTVVTLDGTGSSDPDPGDTLTYAWETGCSGTGFDDPTSAMPTLTVDSSSCSALCSVTLTVTDEEGESDSDSATVTVIDTEAPTLSCPASITVECDQPTDPVNTGVATAEDVCDPDLNISYADSLTPGACPAEFDINRQWTAVDDCGNTASCEQAVSVVDTTAPDIVCNAPATIVPPDAPISFTAGAVDNCAPSPSVEVTGYDCFKFTKKGKRIDKAESCEIAVEGDRITILDSGGVGDHITWTVRASDNCGNDNETRCQVEVVNPGRR